MAEVQHARYEAEAQEADRQKAEQMRHKKRIAKKIETYGKSFQQVLSTRQMETDFVVGMHQVRQQQTKSMLHDQQLNGQRNTFEGPRSLQKENSYSQKTMQDPKVHAFLSELHMPSVQQKNTEMGDQKLHTSKNIELPFSARIFIAPHQNEVRSTISKMQVDPKFLSTVSKPSQGIKGQVESQFIKSGKSSGNSEHQLLGHEKSEGADTSVEHEGVHQLQAPHSQQISREKVMLLQTAFDAFKKQLNIKYPHLRVPAVHPDFGGFEINMRYDRSTGMVKHVQFRCQNHNMTTLLAQNRKGFEQILANYRMSIDSDAFSFLTQNDLKSI